VGVAIGERRHEHAAAGVKDPGVLERFKPRADGDDDAVVDQDILVIERRQVG
jgi:hypothetical protein